MVVAKEGKRTEKGDGITHVSEEFDITIGWRVSP